MSAPANPHRGEAEIAGIRLRPSFAALVAAEAELGSLFTLVDDAAQGRVTLAAMVALFWHVRVDCPLDREAFSARVMAAGLVAAAPVLRQILTQILKGQ